MPDKAKLSDKEIREGAGLAALSYLFFFWALAFLFQKDNKFAHAHARQGLVLFLGELIVICSSVFLPWLGPLNSIAFLVLIVLSFYGMCTALAGKLNRIPLVSELAEKIVV